MRSAIKCAADFIEAFLHFLTKKTKHCLSPSRPDLCGFKWIKYCALVFFKKSNHLATFNLAGLSSDRPSFMLQNSNLSGKNDLQDAV
jgi:hypothetical protein